MTPYEVENCPRCIELSLKIKEMEHTHRLCGEYVPISITQECSHTDLYWGSGGYYIFCSNCSMGWVMRQPYEKSLTLNGPIVDTKTREELDSRIFELERISKAWQENLQALQALCKFMAGNAYLRMAFCDAGGCEDKELQYQRKIQELEESEDGLRFSIKTSLEKREELTSHLEETKKELLLAEEQYDDMNQLYNELYEKLEKSEALTKNLRRLETWLIDGWQKTLTQSQKDKIVELLAQS